MGRCEKGEGKVVSVPALYSPVSRINCLLKESMMRWEKIYRIP